MAHFAELDTNNTVLRVVVTDNNDPNGDEGYQWLLDNLGGNWVKTSYNSYAGKHLLGGTCFRKNFALVGFAYDSERDAFIPPQPYASWTLDEDTCLWQPPTPYPTDNKDYRWDEDTLNWIEIVGE